MPQPETDRSAGAAALANLRRDAAQFVARVPTDWTGDYTMGALHRARRLCQSGRVLDILFDADPVAPQALAWVVDKGPKRFKVGVQLCALESGRQALLTDCTCKAGMFCQHTAALMFTLLALANADAELASDAGTVPARPAQAATSAPADAALGPALHNLDPPWQMLLEQLAQPREAAPKPWPEERQLAFMFATGYGQPARLLCTPMLVKIGKRGGYIGARGLDSEQDQVLPWQREQFSIAAALALAPIENKPPLILRRIGDPHQDAAAERALVSELCFFERCADGAISLGATRRLQHYWSDRDNGMQLLAQRIEDCPHGQLLLGHGLWYFDSRTRQLGRIAFAREALERLRRMPPLPPEQVPALSALLPAGAAAWLPAPNPRPRLEQLRVAPRTALLLRKCEWTHWSKNQFGCRELVIAGLAFDYAGHRCSAFFQTSERHYQPGMFIEIIRDQLAERALLEQLGALGWLTPQPYDMYPLHIERNDLVLLDRGVVAAMAVMPAALDALRRAGVLLEFDASYPQQRLLLAEQWSAEVNESGSDWFDLSLGVDVEGERVDLLPILRAVILSPEFPRKKTRQEAANATWVVALDAERKLALPLQRLRALVDPLWEWLEQAPTGLKLRRSQANVLASMESGARLPWTGSERLRRTLAQLRAGPRAVSTPAGFQTELRPYQRDGLAWLEHLAQAELGGVLADDMGLGKTVQVLAHLLDLKNRGLLARPALVIAPTSLVGNWRAEATRFAPQLRVLVIHGLDRATRFEQIASHDLVITTYPLLQRDREALLRHRFALLILDEAQAIKNPHSQAAGVVRELHAARRLAMTGTPLENHLGELWAQFDAVEPGLLGDQRQFTRLFRTPIEKHQDADKQRRLNARIAPLMLRRRKQDVLTDLPAKTEILRSIEIGGGQRELYEALRLAQHQRVQQAIAERGLAQSGIVVLDALLKLRQCCCDPRLVKLEHARKVKESAKLDALLDLLDSLRAEQRRVLVFSQFAEMLGLISTTLDQRQIAHQRLTGATPAAQRSGLVNDFQSGRVPVFLISLKAGGVGLNLTAADTVIHYDPWWNPAVEAQATDRAHRIGQNQAVFVYKLICAGSVEEKIQALQARKSELACAVLDGGGVSTTARFNASDLSELFAPL